MVQPDFANRSFLNSPVVVAHFVADLRIAGACHRLDVLRKSHSAATSEIHATRWF